jgi:sodium transport system ATP-binding protein
MIEVHNLTKVFGSNPKGKGPSATGESKAVDQVSFSCQPGRIFSLLGPNGAGKTTTLRAIATILSPTAGTVKVAGYDTVQAPNAVRQRIGFLTGTTGLYERITPDEFLNFLGKVYQIPEATYQERKEHLYETLGMQNFRSKRIGKLSSGMKQKVSIARTLIHDPPVLVFDEPTTGLDVITAENIINLIRDSKDQGKTVIFSSHIMSEVDLLCDDLAIIHQGQLLYNDTMDHFRQSMESPSLTEEFIKTVNA